MQQHFDLNLIYALHILLTEGSVTGAAKKMNLSPPAMSRILGKIRRQFDDPIMVRAGKKLVPTPRAIELEQQLHGAISSITSLLSSHNKTAPEKFTRTFVIMANDIFIGVLASGLLNEIQSMSPLVKLIFVSTSEDNDDLLRDGKIDLLIGSLGDWHPEIKTQSLFKSHFQAIVRQGHPIVDNVTMESFVAYPHISVSFQGKMQNKIDSLLINDGYIRNVAVTLPNFYSALMMCVTSDFILPLPYHIIIGVENTGLNIKKIKLPFKLDPINIVQAWHPRQDNDPAHQWLRYTIKKYILEKL